MGSNPQDGTQVSVLIRGLAKPEVCITEDDNYGNCPMNRLWCAQRFAPEDYTMGQIWEDQFCKVPDWCPMVVIPEHHGRLIDADAMKDYIREAMDVNADLFTDEYLEFARAITESFILDVDEQPTVVPSGREDL